MTEPTVTITINPTHYQRVVSLAKQLAFLANHVELFQRTLQGRTLATPKRLPENRARPPAQWSPTLAERAWHLLQDEDQRAWLTYAQQIAASTSIL